MVIILLFDCNHFINCNICFLSKVSLYLPCIKYSGLYRHIHNYAFSGLPKIVSTNSFPNGLNVVKAEYEATELGTFKIENNEIVGIQVGDKYFAKDSHEFIALEDANKDAFKDVYNNALKDPKKLKNALYSL